MNADTFVKISSIKIFDKDAKELYFFAAPLDKYPLSLDFAEILDARFDPAATYILEVRAEFDSEKASQIGMKYLRNGEEQCMGYYIFFNELQPYELFMEALGNVMEVV